MTNDDIPRPVGPAPLETARLWCDLVKSMGSDALDSFELRDVRAAGPIVVR